MAKITQVERQKKNPRRFSIFLDGQFAFGADEDTVVDHRLIKGKEIRPEDLPRILFETEVGALMERMYRLFARRQRSEKEVREYLKKLAVSRKSKGQEEPSAVAVEQIIERLKKKGLVNDRQFAESWVISRRRSKRKGLWALKAELYQKGVAKEIIEETVSSPSLAIREDDLAGEALEKKARVWKGLGLSEFKKKAVEFLVRRGFDYGVAKDAVVKFLKKV